jgi:hypothetical protein
MDDPEDHFEVTVGVNIQFIDKRILKLPECTPQSPIIGQCP